MSPAVNGAAVAIAGAILVAGIVWWRATVAPTGDDETRDDRHVSPAPSPSPSPSPTNDSSGNNTTAAAAYGTPYRFSFATLLPGDRDGMLAE